MSLRFVGTGLLVFAFLAAAVQVVLRNAPPSDMEDREIVSLRQFGTEVNILFVGTSLTAGYSWPAVLAESLEAQLEIPVRYSRVAMPGATSDWALREMYSIVAQAPDIILVEFSINDADLRHRMGLSKSIENHIQLIAGIRNNVPYAKIVLLTMNPAFGFRRLLRPRLLAFYEAYGTIAAQMDVGVVNLYSRWWALPDTRKAIRDGIHPDDAIATEVIVPLLLSYLSIGSEDTR